MNLFRKIQVLPKTQRKIIFWFLIILIGTLLFSFWIKRAQKRLKSFETKEFLKIKSFPLKENLGGDFERLNKIKELIEEIETYEERD